MGRSNKGKKPVAETTQPGAMPAAPSGEMVTPVAQISKAESLNDVAPVSKSGIPGSLGHTYYEYEYLEPIDLMPKVVARVIRLSPYGYFPVDDGAVELTGESAVFPILDGTKTVNKIVDFWYRAPQLMLDKILRRDGVRFLPDSFDNSHILEWRELLMAAIRMQLRMIRTLIDTTSWNEGTQFLREAFARKNRRCMEAENYASTLQVAPIWRTLGDSEPVISSQAGGPILITFIDFSNIISHLGDISSSHPAFLDKTKVVNLIGTLCTSNGVDDMLREVENAIKLLKGFTDTVALDNDGSDPGFTFLTGEGRGIKLDLKYMQIMLVDLGYPPMGPVSGAIEVNLAKWNQILYGEALYGIDLTESTPDVRHPVGYPAVTASSKGVLRRGFVPFSGNVELESGLDEIWAVETQSYVVTWLLGTKCQYSMGGDDVVYPSKFGFQYMDRYGTYALPPAEYNFDDGTAMRRWLQDSLASDHQWNEAVLQRLDNAYPPVKTEQPATYSLHQPADIPFEGLRGALCLVYNLPFYL